MHTAGSESLPPERIPMQRCIIGVGLAIATTGAVAAQAAARSQTPSMTTRSQAHEIKLTGCVSRASDGTFLLTNARVEPARTPAATAGSGASTTAGTTGSTAARPTEPAGSGTSGTTWRLEGGSDLAHHVGHTLEVTGRTESESTPGSLTAPPQTTSSGTPGAEEGTHPRALEVQAIKVISTNCP